MAEKGPGEIILGYISSYLKQTPRTYAEVERDQRIMNSRVETGESEISVASQSAAAGPRRPANEK
jgi:hypothetical protein